MKQPYYNTNPKQIKYTDKKKRKKILLSILIFVAEFCILINLPNFLYQSGIKEPIITFDKYMFNEISDMMAKEDVSMEIANACNNYKYNYDKISCVVYLVNIESEYTKKGYNQISNSSDIVTNGGDCKDYSILYKSIFNNMGIKNELVFNDYLTHVYNKVYLDEDIIYIDQWWFGSEEEHKKLYIN